MVSTRSGRPMNKLVLKKKIGDSPSMEKKTKTDELNTQNIEAEPRAQLPPLFLQKFKKKKEEKCFEKFIGLLK